jgi:hypothetical protein
MAMIYIYMPMMIHLSFNSIQTTLIIIIFIIIKPLMHQNSQYKNA